MTSNPGVQHFSSLPEVAFHVGPEVAIDAGKEVQGEKPVGGQTGNSKGSFWFWSTWRRNTRILVVGGIVLIVVLAAVVGGVLGVFMSKKQASSNLLPSQDSTPTATQSSVSAPTSVSVCRNTICPSMLAIVPDSTPSSPSDSHILFTLGQDGSIYHRRGDGVTWFTNWVALNGTVASQPSAVTFNLSSSQNQTNVFALDANNNLRALTYKNGVWDSNWLNLGGALAGPISACSSSLGSIDLVGREGNSSLLQMTWKSTVPTYSPWLKISDNTASLPFVTCPGHQNGVIDVICYGQVRAPFDFWVQRIDDLGGRWVPKGGTFIGDPFSLARGPGRIDYFGIGADKAMYHMSWTSVAGYSFFQSLGGAFESVPYAIAISADRIDVIAVGTDDRLKHKALIGSTWSSSWDDLGGSFNSAPVAIVGSSGKACVFGIGSDGGVFHGTWTVGAGASWSAGSGWITDGGAMSIKWLRVASS